ncbi:hypothetical protein BHU72_04745 [Desulfuribacillus stibiiarsenatis]|uniref:UPF0033 domain-containing protein n=1 Tax=Desulfuribacillus stibiiarsenatis TaxID=1390249 RepID=A0A1E5L5L1_9FIRM|nr:sulfurtransferase TusA family protein [Desulfuribacillus stibiiarsenatis]OEH85401.1 hypothetical protein BHU72_04745 [Desulfuribacillus stibiiarsenatis]
MQEKTIDCIGEMCPIPILKAEQELKALGNQDKVHIKTDHSCTMQSVVKHFQNKLGYPSSVQEIDYGIWLITIEKRTK